VSNTQTEGLQTLNQAQLDLVAKWNFQNALMNMEKQKQGETALTQASINGIALQSLVPQMQPGQQVQQQMQPVQQQQQVQPIMQMQPAVIQQIAQTQPWFQRQNQQQFIPQPVSQQISQPVPQQASLPQVQQVRPVQQSQPVVQMQPTPQQMPQPISQPVSQSVTVSPAQYAVMTGVITCASGDFLPVDNNRNQFYRCTDNRLVAFNCPSNLVWNYALRACDHSS
jgi:hypothetical protein